MDEKDRELGPIEKLEAHHKGILHRAFSILVFNSKNQLLLQRRAMGKYHTPGLWTNTCCSHPRYGENIVEAIYRRLHEEMGFTCELEEVFQFQYKVKFDNELTENEYDHVFIGRYDGEIHINKDEVEEYKWISLEEVEDRIKSNPEEFTYWFKYLLKKGRNQLYKYLED